MTAAAGGLLTVSAAQDRAAGWKAFAVLAVSLLAYLAVITFTGDGFWQQIGALIVSAAPVVLGRRYLRPLHIAAAVMGDQQKQRHHDRRGGTE